MRFVGTVIEDAELLAPASLAGPALPAKPSIAVLPFTNRSSDPGQDYFVDGMTEEVTIALGRLPWLFVIASNSAFTYKARLVDARQVGAELGVRYMLRGSVRKESDRVRVTVELTDTANNSQLWADTLEDLNRPGIPGGSIS